MLIYLPIFARVFFRKEVNNMLINFIEVPALSWMKYFVKVNLYFSSWVE